MADMVLNKQDAEAIVEHGTRGTRKSTYSIPKTERKYKPHGQESTEEPAVVESDPVQWVRIYKKGDKLQNGGDNAIGWTRTTDGLWMHPAYILDDSGLKETGDIIQVYTTMTYESVEPMSREIVTEIKDYHVSDTETGLEDLETQRFFVIYLSGKWFLLARIDWQFLDPSIAYLLEAIS